MTPTQPPASAGITRRGLIGAAGAFGLGALLTGCTNVSQTAKNRQITYPDSDLLFVSVIQTATNDYMQDWAFGSRVYAAHAGIPLRVINSNLDSSQQYSQIQSAAATGKRIIVNLEPLASADTPAVAKSVARSGGYIVSSWDKPADVHPEDVGPSWVSHMGFDGVSAGEYTATRLFESMGGEGGILALKGVLDSTANKQRFAGLQRALDKYPGITLLDSDSANWDRQTAYEKTRTLLSKHRKQVNGIWTGSDSMTLGALAAAQSSGVQVKASGIDGTHEALKILDEGGPIVATWFSGGSYSGMIGLAIAHAAATDKLDVDSLSSRERDGTFLQVGVDSENVGDYLTPATSDSLLAQLDEGLFARLIGDPITDY